MAQLIHPVFGDLLLSGAVLFAWLFVFFLIGDACWQKRQARALRGQREGSRINRTGRRTRVFFKRLRLVLVALTIVSIVSLMLVRAKENNPSDENDLSSYTTNFQGDATCPVPAAKAVNLDFDAPSPAAQPSAETNNTRLMFQPSPSQHSSKVSMNQPNLSGLASALNR